MKTADDYIRPSSLHPLSLCAGRAAMEAAVVNAFGDPEESEEAAMGTQAHAAVARGLLLWRDDLMSWESAIATVSSEAAESGMDSWTVWGIQACIDFARQLIDRHEITRDNVLIEHPLEMLSQGMARPGTADLVLVAPFVRVIVTDWKFTFLDQGEASEHDQLQGYATSAAATFRANEVIVNLFAPRAEKSQRATAAIFDVSAIAKNQAWTRAVVARAKSPNPDLTPGYHQCLYCRALTRCAAAKEYFMNAVEAIYLIGLPTDPVAWGELAAASKVAEKFAEEAKDQVKNYIIKGGEAVGWGLGSGRAIRTCANPREAIRRLSAAGMDSACGDALSLSVAKLPSEAVDVIRDLVHEHTSAPSLKAVKTRAKS